MTTFNRRNFIRTSGVGLLPALTPFTLLAADVKKDRPAPPANKTIKFFGDGPVFEPLDYLAELGKANAAAAIIKDRYAVGGVVTALEKRQRSLSRRPAICIGMRRIRPRPSSTKG